jgi:hypothetical protein
MLDAFRDIKDYDTIFFVPHSDIENQVKIEVTKYKDQGENLDGSALGNMYDIILFRMDEDDITDLDRFEGILIEPRTYISRMIKDDWYGMVARKTTTSKKLADDVFANWQELSYNIEE